MNERSVGLHLHIASERQAPGSQDQPLPDAPQDGSAERFRQALGQHTPASPQAQPDEAAALAASPMGLFGRPPAAGGAAQPQMLEMLKHSIRGLQVGQEQRSVRLELDEALYLGVAVAVFEDAGAWVAELRCRDAGSYHALAAPAQEMASQLALALRHDALWRVIDESAGPAGGQTDTLTEAFASSPTG